ncbi:N-acetylneuraminate synthase family protein [Flavobacteriaceae bacterium]|nr:N-acetylneuraminate synthase family protein [Flavobacteriaceae bacterium]
MNKVFIIGAGPSGLISAYEFLKKGVEVEIFEQSEYLGGMCRTWQEDNYLLDTGPHIYHTPDKDLEDYWKDIFGDLLVAGEFWSKNVVNGDVNNLVDYPLSWEAINNFEEPLKSTVLNELSNLDQDKSKGAKNFDEYVENLVGRTLTDRFFKKYPLKVWGRTTKELTADWAPKRIEIREKITPFYTGQYAAVGLYGTGCVYERIAEKIIELGGKIHKNSCVTKIFHKNGVITGFKANQKNIQLNPTEVLVSTMPITILGKAFNIDTSLKFRGISSVYIGVKSDEITWPKGVHWLYFDHEEFLFNRVTNSTKLSKEVSPKGYTLLTIESTFSENDELDKYSKKKLENMILEQMKKSGILNESSEIFISSNKEKYVYPLQDKNYQVDLARLLAEIGKYSNLYSIGTGGDFNYADSQVLFFKGFDLVNELTSDDKKINQITKTNVFNGFKKDVNLGGFLVGNNHVPVVIGEIGLNHNGNFELAKELIDKAFDCGLKFVKLQKYKSGNSRVSNKVKSANYIEKITDQEETLSQMFDKYTLSKVQEVEIFKYARKKELIIFSTPFDIDSAKELENDFDVDCYKIASVDLVNLPLIREVASYGKPLILSCGMAKLGDIEDALSTIAETENNQVILLHCNSSYPAPIEDMNLNVIKTLKKTFNVPVGLSDHTTGLLAATISFSIGANIIERHFTLDRFMEGPDHILSSEPKEMKELVELSKSVQIALGDGVKRVQPGEYLNMNLQRKGLYANKDLKIGDIISLSDISVKGPGGGILPKYLDIIVGRELRKNVLKDHPITWKIV